MVRRIAATLHRFFAAVEAVPPLCVMAGLTRLSILGDGPAGQARGWRTP